MHILGISAFYHDSAAALIKDGAIIAAAQEERFTRKKHDPRFPKHAAEYCLAEAGITANELDHVVFYDKPFLTFDRLLMTYLTIAPVGLKSWLEAMPYPSTPLRGLEKRNGVYRRCYIANVAGSHLRRSLCLLPARLPAQLGAAHLHVSSARQANSM